MIQYDYKGGSQMNNELNNQDNANSITICDFNSDGHVVFNEDKDKSTSTDNSNDIQPEQPKRKKIRTTINREINRNMKKQKEAIKQDRLSIFGKNLEGYRKNKGLSKIQIANMLGLMPSNYNRYEQGTSEPGALTAIQLAKVLDVSVEELFSVDSSDNALSAQAIQSFYEAQGLATSYDGKDNILLLIDSLPQYKVPIPIAREIKEYTVNVISPIIQSVVISQLSKYHYIIELNRINEEFVKSDNEISVDPENNEK